MIRNSEVKASFDLNKAYIEDLVYNGNVDITDKKQLGWLKTCVNAAGWLHDTDDKVDDMDMSWLLDKLENVLNDLIERS